MNEPELDDFRQNHFLTIEPDEMKPDEMEFVKYRGNALLEQSSTGSD
jgi:hypothetical protein